MTDADALDERLRAVERALTDDSDLTDLSDAAELARETERLSTRLDDVEERLDDLDAATQALRGYVGNVRAVDRSVERRADAALAKVEELETRLRESDSRADADRRTRESADSRPTSSVDRSRRPTRAAERRPRSDCPCNCDAGRLGTPPSADRADGESENESADGPGPLARLAAALTGGR